MTTKRRKALRTFECPECQQKAVLQRILYGMPDLANFDFEKYAVGGCLVFPGQPDVACKECGWTGHRYFLENPDDIRDITDIIF
jgi:DNA-directed RNA polymerase subunit RPC12/RpoP